MMRIQNILNVCLVLYCLFVAFDSIGQYRIYDGGHVLAPMPDGGVVVLSTDDGYLTKATLYDDIGQSGSIPTGHLTRMGDVGDYAFSGDSLFYLPGSWLDWDVSSDLGIYGLLVSADSISLQYSFYRRNYIGHERSIGLAKDSHRQVIVGGDSVFVFSELNNLVYEFENLGGFGNTNGRTRSYVVDIDNTNLLADVVIVNSNGITSVEHYSFDESRIKADTFISSYLDSWTNDGKAFIYLSEGLVEIGVDSLVTYPSSLGEIEQVYDADEVAVLRNARGQYYSFDPSFGFEPINRSESTTMEYVLKRTEGWYSLAQGVLTFSADSLEVPLTNPLTILINLDSASQYVEYQGPQNTPVNFLTVKYTLHLGNTADTIVPSALVEILGPGGSFDPSNPGPHYSYASIGAIGPHESVSYSGVHTFQLASRTPLSRTSLYACIQTVNGERFTGGEPPCSYGATTNVTNIVEATSVDLKSIQVVPNPIVRTFQLNTDRNVNSAQLVNSIGQTVQYFNGNLSQRYQLSNSIPTGLYTLQVYFATGERSSVKVLLR